MSKSTRKGKEKTAKEIPPETTADASVEDSIVELHNEELKQMLDLKEKGKLEFIPNATILKNLNERLRAAGKTELSETGDSSEGA